MLSLRRDDVLRVIVSLIADELTIIRGRTVKGAVWASWSAETSVDEDGLGVDSLDRLNLVARVNEFFRLHAVGTEDYLLVERTLGAWADIVLATLAMTSDAALCFRTSGSTGEPKKINQSLARLGEEIEALATIFAGRTRIVAMTPPHHIYGFLFSAALPARLPAPVLDARGLVATSLRGKLQPGDLVVATPHLWEHVAAAGGPAMTGVVGATSGAPAPASLWPRLAAEGLVRLVEVYGSSETAGVGWRDAAHHGFALFPHWRRVGDGVADAAGEAASLQDALAWEGERFRPAGRHDGAVQVAGVNVFPGRVQATLREHPGVIDCVVRLEPSIGRLKAFVVPAGAADAETLAAFCAERLAAAERPARFAFGDALPRTPEGKLRDWD